MPVSVIGLPSTARVTALTSSWEGSGAQLSNGAYYDSGYNAAGQIGVFQGGSGAKNGQSVAILANPSVWSWGDNDRGQLGVGTRISSEVPVRVDVSRGVTPVSVSSGGYASYAVDRSGPLWAWGDNKSRQLGTGSSPTIATKPLSVGFYPGVLDRPERGGPRSQYPEIVMGSPLLPSEARTSSAAPMVTTA